MRRLRQRAAESVAVTTAMRFFAPPDRVWGSLLLYEQIVRRPPPYLRWLLPAPLRTEGLLSAVGEETRCVYREGYLVKRVTEMVPPRVCRFEVTRQEVSIAGGVRLASGSYALRPLPDGSTDVELETRYWSARPPRWLWRPIEKGVCHAFHRYLLRAMRAAAQPLSSTRRSAAEWGPS